MPLPIAPPPFGPMSAPAMLAGVRPRLERRTRGFVPGSPLRRWDDRLDLARGLALDLAAPALAPATVPAYGTQRMGPRRTAAVTSTPAMAIVAVAVSVGFAQAADLLTFVRMILTVGPQAEANPLVRNSIGLLGLEGLALLKVALVVFVVATFAFVYRYHPRVAAFVATVGTVAGIIGAFSNVIALG